MDTLYTYTEYSTGEGGRRHDNQAVQDLFKPGQLVEKSDEVIETSKTIIYSSPLILQLWTGRRIKLAGLDAEGNIEERPAISSLKLGKLGRAKFGEDFLKYIQRVSLEKEEYVSTLGSLKNDDKKLNKNILLEAGVIY